jgi:hypothetical protein
LLRISPNDKPGLELMTSLLAFQNGPRRVP